MLAARRPRAYNFDMTAAARRANATSQVIRAADRTLASEEVASAVDQVIAHLAKSLGAELRG